jgi:light-regulated signal transduction histidine kinase (bacteriophytochrome)
MALSLGATNHTCLTVKFPLSDHPGKPFGTCAISTDIRERKVAEAEMRGMSVERERSNQDMGQFTYAAPHNLQEPLGMVTSDLQLLSTHSEGGWTFSVSDNGIGIDPDYFDRAFAMFRRLHVASEISGSGIGLATSRRIIERHGGRIWIESASGEGSVFSFTISDRAPNKNSDG